MAIDNAQNVFQPDAQAQAKATQQAQSVGGFTPEANNEQKYQFSFSQGYGFDDYNQIQSGSGTISAIKKLFEEKYKDASIQSTVIPMLRENHGEKFRYSSLIVTTSALDASTGTLNVAYHVLLIEASNPVKPENYRANSDRPGQQVNLPRFACDGIDSEYISTARELVARAYKNASIQGVKVINPIYADSEVVPDTVKVDDVERIGHMAENALHAAVTQLKRITTRVPFDLTKTQPTPFVMEHTFRDGNISDLNGQAVRSDVIVRLSARTEGKRNTFTLNGGNEGQTVSNSSMFIDLMYTQRQNAPMGMFGKVDKIEPCFVPRAVITNVACSKGYSLEMFLLQLYAANSVYDSGAFRRSLINKQPKKGDMFDMTDIGACNVLANVGNETAVFATPYSTRGADVNETWKAGFLQTICQPVPLMSLDCQIAGPSSWQTTTFQRAAEGGKAGKDAESMILNAAMNLTGGQFGAFFDDNDSIVAYREIIPMGYWQDQEGNMRDLREFDTLAILNRYGNEHPEQIAKWIHAQSDAQRPEDLRLTDMISVIEDASSMRAVNTGRAIRVTIHPKFMHALREAIKMTKHTFTSVDSFTDAANSALMGASFLNWGALANSGIMNANGYNRASMNNFNQGVSVFGNGFNF